MSDILTRIKDLQTKAEKTKTDINKYQGALDTHMKTLLDTYKCKTLEEAETLADSLQTEIEVAEKEIEESVKAIEKELEKIEE
ncbi:MAG: hypothetical protein WC346_15225 [Methanogenium sp.]|jgi:hypothetical protein